MVAPRKQIDEKAVFNAARKLGGGPKQETYLLQACSDDPDALSRIRDLLGAHDNAASFLEAPPPGILLDVAEPETGGITTDTIGPYKLREQIGEGGMGIVYVAEQATPVRRRVALKVIKPGMDSREVIARFEAEKQALALMDHPHVARVIDAGATEQGRPYFVMELVRGFPITDYCDQAKLNTRERLDLFRKVCQGVQHAHLKGIIHRDLKPGNVLVTLYDGVPVPKVIDFGVAKALNQRLAEQSVYTQFRQMIGTPAYMSPEQAEMSGFDVDTRSDVYSLGVLLYELLTGTTPFDKEALQTKGFDEMRRMIREQEPPRPSHRISTLDATAQSTLQSQRGVDPRQLSQSLMGELDWIVMKALEKDRSRRYQTVAALAQDIERFLVDDPVEACPPSSVYRLRKYAKRHKALLTTSALVTLTALIGTAVSLWYAKQWSLAADQATAALVTAEQSTREAEEATRKSETLLYAADMKLASDAIGERDVSRAAELLQRHTPAENGSDDPGFPWHFYWKQVSPPPSIELEQGGWVDDVEISPDGNWVAASGSEGKVYVYDGTTFKQQKVLATRTASVDGLAWSPDSRHIAAACSDGSIQIWDFASAEIELKFAAHDGVVNDVAFGSEGRVLYSCGSDELVRSWDARTGEAISEFSGHKRAVERVAVSSDGSVLATAGSDSALGIWAAQSARLQARHQAEFSGQRVSCVVHSPDGRFVAAGDIYGGLHLADVKSGQSKKLSQQSDGIEAVAFFKEGTLIATADRGGAIQLYPTPASLDALDAIGSSAVMRWMAHQGRALSLASTSDGEHLISGGRDGVVRVWIPDLESTRWLPRKMKPSPLGPVPCDLAIAGDKRVYISEDRIELWNLADRRLKETFAHAKPPWHRVAGTADGRFLAAVRPAELTLFDPTAGKPLRTWALSHKGNPTQLALSSDGRLIAMVDSNNDDLIVLYENDDPQEKPKLISTSRSGPLAFSPDGRWLAACARELNIVRVWDLHTGGEPRVFSGHSNSLADLAFSVDGKLLATVGHDRLLKVWQFPEGEERFSIVAHSSQVETVAFTPDGKTIATAGRDRRVRLWHTATGQPLGELQSEKQGFHQLGFSTDGLRLIGLLDDGSVVVYDAGPHPKSVQPSDLRTASRRNTDG